MSKKAEEVPADICLQFCEDTGIFPREGQGSHSPYGRIGVKVSPYIFP